MAKRRRVEADVGSAVFAAAAPPTESSVGEVSSLATRARRSGGFLVACASNGIVLDVVEFYGAAAANTADPTSASTRRRFATRPLLILCVWQDTAANSAKVVESSMCTAAGESATGLPAREVETLDEAGAPGSAS